MNTVVARFHHPSRDLDHLESALVQAGAGDAQITGYTVALTFDDGSREAAVEAAHQALERIGATRIKTRRRRLGRAQNGSDRESAANDTEVEPASLEDPASGEATASLMAKVKMGVFGHP